MTNAELIALIGNNEAALSALPENLRKEILAVKKEKEDSDRRLAEARTKANIDAQRKREEEDRIRREKEEAERKELLCIGTWAENIPRNRRFVLCERDWQCYAEYVTGGGRYNDPHELVPVKELCAVDIVRGYMSPYFGYYCGDGEKPYQLKSWWEERLKPAIMSETTDSFLTRIRCDWNFFKIYEREEFPFRILTYGVDKWGVVNITGRSVCKTWQEHRADLEKEFAKGAEE